MTYHLTVLGGRMSGKSQLLLREGISDARNGAVVLYNTESVQMEEVRFDDAERITFGNRVNATRSDHIIRFDGGGLIAFRGETRYSDWSLLKRSIDTHLIDNCRWTDPHPTATRVIRALPL